jgi:hypothetical protein
VSLENSEVSFSWNLPIIEKNMIWGLDLVL